MASAITASVPNVDRTDFRTIFTVLLRIDGVGIGELLMVLEHRGGVISEANMVDMAVRGRAPVALGKA